MTNQYEQLKEFLRDCCIERELKLFDVQVQIRDIKCDAECMTIIYTHHGKYASWRVDYSYHDLFSVDSGLMSFVSRWEWDRYTALRQMCALDKEWKISYFLSNALLPTQDVI
jgi:hypothetical protein